MTMLLWAGTMSAASIKQHPALIKGVLPNGLTYYIYPNGYPKGEAVYRLFVKSGSVNETASQRGLAHFLEHMAFNGTVHFPGNKMVQFLESRGAKFGKDLNAHTSFNETVYKLQLPSADIRIVDSTLTILSDWAKGLLLDSAEIEAERGVVLSEWLSNTGPQADVSRALLAELLNGSRYAQRIVIGDTAVIRHFHRKELLDYYHNWYRPELMAVAIVGDVNGAETERLIKAKFGESGGRKAKNIHYTIPPYQHADAGIVMNQSLTKTELNIIQLLPLQQPVRTEAGYRTYLAQAMFNRLMKARFTTLSFDNPAYLKAEGSASSFLNAATVMMATAELDTLKMKEGVRDFLTALNQMSNYGFLQSEIQKQKRIYLSQLKRKAESKAPVRSDELMNELYADYFSGNVFCTPQEEYRLAQKYMKDIDSVQMHKLAANMIVPQKMHYLLTSYERMEIFENKQSLLDFITRTVSEKPALYAKVQDQIPDDLLDNEPQPGTIVQRSTMDAIGAQEWKLSNGATVIFKRSVTDKGKISLSAFRKTGSYTLPADDYVSSLVAGNVVALSGAGRFSREALSGFLAGNSASVRFLIDKTRSGVAASANTGDFETMFRLLFLKWTQPKMDIKIFNQTKEKSIQEYKTANKTEETRFYDEFSRLLKKEDYTTRELTDSVLTRELRSDRILPVFNHCFGSASGFTFVIMADCEPSEVEDYVLKYIGGLPAGPDSFAYVYQGGEINCRAAQLQRRAGDSPKAVVSMVFQQKEIKGDLSLFNLQNEIIAGVLKMKLLSELREKMGMIYSVGVSSGATLFPQPLSRNSISFKCLPENVDVLTAKVRAVLAEMRKSPGSFEKELADVKVNLLKTLALDRQKDSFWSTYIRNTIYNNENNRAFITDYAHIVQSVTSSQIAELLPLNYDTDNVIESILLPKLKK